jgi:hypothetical protein
MKEERRGSFDESLDEVLHVDQVPGDRGKNIEFKVAAYNGGPPKLRLTRIGYDGIHAKLGGMTRVEIGRVRDKMTEILDMEIEEKKIASDKKEEVAEGSDSAPKGTEDGSLPDSKLPF